MEEHAPRTDWPFLSEPPPGRIELQRQLVASDPFFRLLGVRLDHARQGNVTLALAFS
jgi:hypothetical protein